MAEQSKRFGPYLATVDGNQCFIEDTVLGASGSLECADQNGTLMDNRTFTDVEIPQHIVSTIRRWAVAHGY